MKIAAGLQHVAFEGLDGFEPVLLEHGYEIVIANAADGVPDSFRDADLLFILGGPISANDEDRYPFITDELRLIEHRLTANRPIFGICLGAQLIARALGAKVYPSGSLEIGFAPIELTAAGKESCLQPFADQPVALHWHGETFDVPDGATLLASTEICPNQAFSRGPEVMAMQFHPEATGTEIEYWLIGHTGELTQAGIDVNGLRAGAANHADELTLKSDTVVRDWLTSLEAR